MAQQEQTWHDMSPLGFPGWEHSDFYDSTTGTALGKAVHRFVEVRMFGSQFISVFSGPNVFADIRRHVEMVEFRLQQMQEAA